jgi:hypothetical protein
MLRASEMKMKAEQCARRWLTKPTDRSTADTLRELVGQWRDMAAQLEALRLQDHSRPVAGVSRTILPQNPRDMMDRSHDREK